MANKRVISFSPSPGHRRIHRHLALLGLCFILYASNTFVIPGLHWHRAKTRNNMCAEMEDGAENTHVAVELRKKFEEFKEGDDVAAVITQKTRLGIFCDINAEKDVLLNGPASFKRLLNINEKVNAKIQKIDLEQRRVSVEIPDWEQLVQSRKNSTKFEEFEVGDDIEAVVVLKSQAGTFCDINAEKDVLVNGPIRLKKLLKIGEKVKAKIQKIDLEKRRAFIDIPDLDQLVQGRSLPPKATPAQTESKLDSVEIKPGSSGVTISGLDLANVDVDYEKGTIRITLK